MKRYQRSQDNSANALNAHLSALFAQTTPDPLDLGKTAVALELIRRDEAAKLATLQTNAAAQLTPAQASLVQNLDAAASLISLVQDAQCAYLLTPQPSSWFDTSAFYPSGIISGLIDPKLGLPIIPPAPTGSFCGSAIFPISVRDYLSLTDAQVAAIYQASAAYNDFYARQQNRLADLKQRAQDLLAAGNTDPVVLGQTYVDTATIGQQIRDKSAQLRDAAQSLLTPAQTAKLKTLQDVQILNSSGIIFNAVSCNLMVYPVGAPHYGSNSCYLN